MTWRPHLRFAAVMTAYVGIIFLVDRDEVLGSFLAPLTVLTARSTLVLLHWFGMDAVREANVIAHPHGFAFQIYYSCTGFVPVVSLIVSILAYPGLLRDKLVGIAVGVPTLVILNLVRLAHLFFIGVYSPAIFEHVHHTLWENFLILTIIVLWLCWVIWSEGRAKAISSTAVSSAGLTRSLG